MRTLTALMLILAMLSSASAADPCETEVNIFVGNPHPLQDHALNLEFARILKTAGIPGPVYICEYDSGFESPHALQWPSKSGLRFGIYLPKLFVAIFSSQAMRGILAHELGHVYLWTPGLTGALPFPRSAERRLDVEMKADALAAEWVGADAVFEGLTAVGGYVLPRLPKEFLAESEKELTARLNVLRNAPLP